eukprot:9120737-Alexandrium_andersonii.AAC.1
MRQGTSRRASRCGRISERASELRAHFRSHFQSCSEAETGSDLAPEPLEGSVLWPWSLALSA